MAVTVQCSDFASAVLENRGELKTPQPRSSNRATAQNITMNKLKVYLPIAIVAVVVLAIVFRVPKLRAAIVGA